MDPWRRLREQAQHEQQQRRQKRRRHRPNEFDDDYTACKRPPAPAPHRSSGSGPKAQPQWIRDALTKLKAANAAKNAPEDPDLESAERNYREDPRRDAGRDHLDSQESPRPMIGSVEQSPTQHSAPLKLDSIEVKQRFLYKEHQNQLQQQQQPQQQSIEVAEEFQAQYSVREQVDQTEAQQSILHEEPLSPSPSPSPSPPPQQQQTIASAEEISAVESSPDLPDASEVDEVLPASERPSPSPHHVELEGHHYRYATPSPHVDAVEDQDEHEHEGSGVERPQAYVSTVMSASRLGGCRSVDEFERIRTISEGTYGVVHEARDKATGEAVALKKIKLESDSAGFPVTSLREINILMSLQHPNLVQLKEIVLGRRAGAVFMVMEYVPHELKSLLKAKPEPFSASEVKCLMLQLLDAVSLLHRHFVVHRDLKTSNLLLGADGTLKVADLGLARRFGSPLAPLSPLVVTLWYRSPELLLGASQYSTAVDMWAVGCIMAELLTGTPLFEGAQGELDQLQRIFGLLGTPDTRRWPSYASLPHAKTWAWKPQPHSHLPDLLPRAPLPGRPAYLSSVGLDLLQRLLAYDPMQRISADEALRHEWFEEAPRAQHRSMISLAVPRKR